MENQMSGNAGMMNNFQDIQNNNAMIMDASGKQYKSLQDRLEQRLQALHDKADKEQEMKRNMQEQHSGTTSSIFNAKSNSNVHGVSNSDQTQTAWSGNDQKSSSFNQPSHAQSFNPSENETSMFYNEKNKTYSFNENFGQ